MVRKGMWLIVLAAGALSMGCASRLAGTPGTGSAAAIAAAWEAPAEYQNAAEVTVTAGATTTVGLGYTYFFSPIKTAETVQPLGYTSPRKLAPFFWDKSHAGVRVSDLEDFGDAWSIDGVYLVPNTKLQVTAEIGGAINNPGNRPWWRGVDDEIAYKVGLQYAFLRNLKARCDFITEGSMSQVDLGAIYVAELGGRKLSAFLEGVLDTSGINKLTLNLGLDFFITDDISVGGTVSDMLKNLSGLVYVARANYYTGPLSLGLSYTSLAGAGNDALGVNVGYEF